MGLPFWGLPEQLEIGGVRYPIDADFRTGIRVRQMWCDPYFAPRPRLLFEWTAALLFRCAELPAADGDTAAAVLWYLMDGRVPRSRLKARMCSDAHREASGEDADDGTERVFSYKWDMPLVYAVFREYYGLDLCTAQLHLWQFDALFSALPDTCVLRRVTSVRAQQLSSAADDAARAVLAAEQLRLRIPKCAELNEMCIDIQNNACSFAKDSGTIHTNCEGGLC